MSPEMALPVCLPGFVPGGMREENLNPRKAVGRKIQRPSSLLSPNFLRRAAYL